MKTPPWIVDGARPCTVARQLLTVGASARPPLRPPPRIGQQLLSALAAGAPIGGVLHRDG